MSVDLAASRVREPARDLPPRRPGPMALVRQYGVYMLGGVLFVLAMWVLHDVLRDFHYRDLKAAVGGIGWRSIGSAILLTALSFAALVGYEHCALLWAGRRLPLARTALAAFVAQSIAHSTGFALFVGASLRYQLYAGAGLDVTDVARVQAFFSATFFLGVTALLGLVLLLEPAMLQGVLPLPPLAWQAIGTALLLAVASYLGWSMVARRPFSLLGHTIVPPGAGSAALQICLAILDLGAAAGALWVLLPDQLGIGYFALAGMYVAAIIIGLLSHVPGGLGVFESTMLLQLRPGDGAVTATVGALLLFRAIYYLLPLLLGTSLLAGLELARLRGLAGATARQALRWLSPLLPVAAAGLALLAGGVLLFSGATPAVEDRLAFLGNLVPLAAVELAHFLSGLVGTALLLMARPLQRRIAGAWQVTIVLLGAGAVLSVLKGIDVEEAALLLFTLVILLPCRREFYRRSRLVDERLSGGWWLAVAVMVGASIWLVLFAYKHVEYRSELWWLVELQSNAPRSLRAALGAVVLLALAAILHLFRAPAARPHPPDEGELALARAIVERSPASDSHLALTGDKALLFDAAGSAFLMYGVCGRSWVALGEPVGPMEAWPGLLWSFRELADRHGGFTAFYQVGPENLPLFLDLGLQIAKLGERARISLATFDLRGKRHADLRNARNRAAKAGASFAVLEGAEVLAVLDELERVSDGWLAEHRVREKRFSLGFFSRPYIAGGPVAVVRRQGRITAFANLWLGADQEECSLDLMRFAADAPPGTMDHLFTETILWARERGFRWLDLGMAPLSGLPDHRLAPLFSRLGRFMVRHGAQFYNFAGLRAFKEKFDPQWQPSYLLYPPRALPRVLGDITALIAGGWSGILQK